MILELGRVQPQLQLAKKALELWDPAASDASQAATGRREFLCEPAFCLGGGSMISGRLDCLSVRLDCRRSGCVG